MQGNLCPMTEIGATGTIVRALKYMHVLVSKYTRLDGHLLTCWYV